MEYALLKNLSLSIDPVTIEKLLDNQTPFKGYPPNQDTSGLFYYHAPFELIDTVKKLLPKSLRDEAEISLCRILQGVFPHRDHDCKSKINFYIQAGRATTVFFNDPDMPGYKFNGDGEGNIYSLQKHKLSKTSSFRAQDNETYLLDTSKIHMVIMPKDNVRLILSVSFKSQYADVLDKMIYK